MLPSQAESAPALTPAAAPGNAPGTAPQAPLAPGAVGSVPAAHPGATASCLAPFPTAATQTLVLSTPKTFPYLPFLSPGKSFRGPARAPAGSAARDPAALPEPAAVALDGNTRRNARPLLTGRPALSLDRDGASSRPPLGVTETPPAQLSRVSRRRPGLGPRGAPSRGTGSEHDSGGAHPARE